MVSKISRQAKVLSALVALLGVFSAPARAADDAKWASAVPKVAEKPEDWAKLIPDLKKNGMAFGSLAAARDMLSYFADLPTKELAYRTIIDFADSGLPISVKGDFVAGDIDPSGSDNFAQSYLLYKGVVNADKHMEKWADYYFNKINKETFPKYLFYRATEAYAAGDLAKAVQLLTQAIPLTTGPENLSLAKKEARTLARIHYELGEYDKSSEIYEQFLLNLNPITPSDWLEQAWNLYKMKKFPEALGMIYNLESHAAVGEPLLEKYILRSLIYREHCVLDSTDALIKKFNAEFGPAIDGIKIGEPLTSFPILNRIDLPEAKTYRQYSLFLNQLALESANISALPSSERPLAQFVYTSETNALKRVKQIYEDQALEALARHLVILGESLHFLHFDVQREKFNPDRVFAQTETPKTSLVDSEDKNFRIHWIQWGDFWRDERQIYTGQMKNKCVQ